jgi:hypothetical protein
VLAEGYELLRGLSSVVVKALRYATSRKVPISIPGPVTGDFFPEASDKSLCPGSTLKMRTRIFLGVKPTLPPSCAECLEIWEPFNLLDPSRPRGPVTGILYLYLRWFKC